MRTYTQFCARDPAAVALVNELPKKASTAAYRDQMTEIGRHLADGIIPSIDNIRGEVCVVCTVEDADFLARGLIERLESVGLGDKLRLICLWNDKIRHEGVSLSPIVREYKEPIRSDNSIFIVVKSIISGACVVKTNLTRAISIAQPSKIFVAAPVMLVGAEGRLAREFPKEISSKFEFVHFATDTKKEGENVIPGIGGSVYELLGLGDSKAKNRYVPTLVKERRARYFDKSGLATA